MRISPATLNRIITSEIKNVLRESRQPRRRSLSSLIFEEDAKGQNKEEAPKVTGDNVKGKTNIKDVDPSSLYDLLVSRDKNLKLWSEISAESGNTLDPDKTADFWSKMGKEKFVARWTDMAGKLPDSGLPKSEMPFLPGPDDANKSTTVDDLADVLTPGGKYNVDFESVSRRGPALTEATVYRRWGKLAGIISEKWDAPPAPNKLKLGTPEAEKYLKSGLEDGNDSDDNIKFEKDGKIKVSAAIPTQKNVNVGKTIAFATPKEAGGRGIKAGPLGAYGSTDDEILDGHHRWSGLMMTNPEGEFQTFMKIDLKAVGGGDKKKGLQHLTAIGNALGNETKT